MRQLEHEQIIRSALNRLLLIPQSQFLPKYHRMLTLMDAWMNEYDDTCIEAAVCLRNNAMWPDPERDEDIASAAVSKLLEACVASYSNLPFKVWHLYSFDGVELLITSAEQAYERVESFDKMWDDE